MNFGTWPMKWTASVLAFVILTGPWPQNVSGKSSVPKKLQGGVKKRTENIVKQGFPVASADPDDLTKSDTGWVIDWKLTNTRSSRGQKNQRGGSSVLMINSAKFMYKDQFGKVRWITVLKNLELGEMFVPYDTGSPQFEDVAGHSFRIIKAKQQYLGPNCVGPGEILTSSDSEMSGKVMKELHDDGLRWLNGSNVGRRGEKMTLWCIFDGGNYRYLIEYNFKDDGSIVCRVGGTAKNYYDQRKDGKDVHLHVGCWRFDMCLSDPMNPLDGGPEKNILKVVRRVPHKKPGTFRIDTKPYNPDFRGESREGHLDWVPKEFTTLRVESTVRKNRAASPAFTAYDIIPLRYGSVRDFGKRHEYVNHDFWVTRVEPKFHTYRKVHEYAKDHRSLKGQPLRLWHSAATLHNPRAEDFGPDGKGNKGAAVVTWAGFVMRPRNLFDSTPLKTVSRPIVFGKEAFRATSALKAGLRFDSVKKRSYCQVHTHKMNAGTSYTIDMIANFDAYLRLEDPNGKRLARDDDGGEGHNSRITFRPTKDGNYRIIATSYSARKTGKYTLTIREAKRPSVGKAVLDYKGKLTKTATFDRRKKRSYFRVHTLKLRADSIYTIDLTGDFDTYLRVENLANVELDNDDDGGEKTNSRLTFRPARDEQYHIIVTSYSDRVTGDYNLVVRERKAK
ncbi:MAG: hypothetical protein ACFCD0_06660 [Gemmataceae bacterium]